MSSLSSQMFYCQELFSTCSMGVVKQIHSFSPGWSLVSVQTLTHNSESILCSYSPQPVSHLQCSQMCSSSFSNILPLASKFVFYSCFFLLQHSFIFFWKSPIFPQAYTHDLSFHLQHKFSHQLYQFHNTISNHLPLLSDHPTHCLQIYHDKFISHHRPFLAIPVAFLLSSL